MNVEYFGYIIEIAEQGSISKAARSLYLSQPYLSRIIKELEEELNLKLFSRTNVGISPTVEGIEFIKKAKVIMEQYHNLSHLKKKEEQQSKGFKLATVRSSLVMESFIQLTQEYKNEAYEFSLKETDSRIPLREVYYMKADIGIIYNLQSSKNDLLEELKRKDMVYEKICNFHFCYILGVHHPLLKQKDPITIRDLYKYGFVAYPEESLPYKSKEHNTDIIHEILELPQLKKIVYVNSRAAYHNMLTQMNFFSIGTQHAKGQDEKFNIVSIPFLEEERATKMEMGVLYRKNTTLPEAAIRMIGILKENYNDESSE